MKQDTWNLNDLVEKKNIPKKLKEAERIVIKIESYKKRFNENISSREFREILKLSERYIRTISGVAGYSSLWFSENTHNKEALALKNKINDVSSGFGNRLLWVDHKFIKFKKKHTKRLIKACPEYRYHLKRVVDNSRFLLTEKEEKLILIKDINGVGSLARIYDILTNGFKYKIGKKTYLQHQLINLVKGKDKELRKKAYESLLKPYRKNETLLGEIYRAIASDWHQENVKLRKFRSPISVRNKANDIKDNAVETLLKANQENLGIFRKYFSLKAKRLNYKKLSRYDIYAPVKLKKQNIPYKKGAKMVLDSFREFSPEFYKKARLMFEKRHIHSTDTENKRTGAFCSSNDTRVIPYVLVNYSNNEGSVSTLAHELGHAIHYMLAAKKQNLFHYDLPLPVAETASIFSELILMEKIKEENKKVAELMMFRQLENIYASIPRQAEIVLFEKDAHEKIRNHASTDDLKKLYLKRIRNHFGKNINVPEIFKNEWNYIGHIYGVPFYCYAYSFGNLLALSTYARYKKEGKSYVKNIMSMLSKGGNGSIAEIVSELGFDIEKRKFYQEGFGLIKKMVREIS